MNILALDTSGPVCGVAVLSDGRVLYEGAAVNRMTHSANLMPMVDEAFARCGVAFEAIDLFACVVGPGSFTGVRIGVSTVKGMAHGADKPCVGVDALEALAAGLTDPQALLCPIQDARAGQVYGAVFTAGMPPVRRTEDEAIPLDGFIDRALAVAESGQPLCFMGDGVGVHREAITARLGARAVFPPAHLSYLRPSAVAMLAQAHAEDQVHYVTLLPKYLRAPQAERARAERQKETKL